MPEVERLLRRDVTWRYYCKGLNHWSGSSQSVMIRSGCRTRAMSGNQLVESKIGVFIGKNITIINGFQR